MKLDSKWFSRMFSKANNVTHIAKLVHKQGYRAVAVVADVEGKDTDTFSINDKGMIIYALVDDQHRRDCKVMFSYETKKGAVDPVNERCAVEIPQTTEQKAIDMVFGEKISFTVIDDSPLQETFLSYPTFLEINNSGTKQLTAVNRMTKTISFRKRTLIRQQPQSIPQEIVVESPISTLSEIKSDSPRLANNSKGKLVPQTSDSKSESTKPDTESDNAKQVNFSRGYALVIGIANYPNVRRLPNTILNDARDLADLLINPEYCGYQTEKVVKLLDERATGDAIREELRLLADKVDQKDTAIIYFSGHGGKNKKNSDDNFLLPFDVKPHNLSKTAISGNELTQLVREIKAERLLVLFDSCYSGGAGETKNSPDDLESEFKFGFNENYYERLAVGKGRVLIASSRSDESSLVFDDMPNSLFTHYLLGALSSKARTKGDGLIRVFELFDYTAEKVTAYANERSHNQHPVFKAAEMENNFPVSLYKGGKAAKSDSEKTSSLHTKVEPAELNKVLQANFSLEDIKELILYVKEEMRQYGIDSKLTLDDFTGGKRSKILELIEYLEYRQQLHYLVAAIRRVRSGVI